MKKMSEYSVITTTCGIEEEAARLSSILIESHLAACVQISEITSCYEWKGVVNREREHLLTIKARSVNYKKIEQIILQNHSYEVPEIIQIPIISASESYMEWIDSVSS
jgi:periplasmic divalent cation tolerance protein